MVVINPTEQTSESNTGSKARFRWIYVVLPLAFLAATIILAAVFYAKLTPSIAYHFTGDTPDRWLSRGAFLGWMLAPQFFFTLLAIITVRLLLTGARYWSPESTPLYRLVPVMGNMPALPQLILLVAMLEFLLYNAYHTRPFPVWIIAIIILAAGGIGLAIFFIRTIRQFRRQQGKNLRE
ncbi:MAG: hypothetical protein ABR886_07545 [Dehalococcoidales bacterium]